MISTVGYNVKNVEGKNVANCVHNMARMNKREREREREINMKAAPGVNGNVGEH